MWTRGATISEDINMEKCGRISQMVCQIDQGIRIHPKEFSTQDIHVAVLFDSMNVYF